MVDRISAVRVRGFKSLADVDLRLDDLTVLIGDNGVGKSALVEACDILHRAPGAQFLDDLGATHAFPSPIRASAASADFEVELPATASLPALRYGFGVRRTDGRGYALADERLLAFEGGSWRQRLELRGGEVFITNDSGYEQKTQHSPTRLALAGFVGREDSVPELTRVARALEAIDIQVPFVTTAGWLARGRGERSLLREASRLLPATRLERGGANLASVYFELRNQSSWQETLEVARLGIGDDLEDIRVRLDAAGQAALSIKRRALTTELPASAISDGTLAFLCFVALLRMPVERSLLVFDEPELHLHPRLLSTVSDLFSTMSSNHPVLLSTHSDRILDLLSRPAEQVVLVRLDEHDATVLERPNADALTLWLDDEKSGYRGLGAIVSAGHEASVFVDKVTQS